MFDAQCAALAAETERLVALYGVPGVAVGVINGDDEYVAGFGVTNREHPLPVDADTLFQIGSTTKTVTGTLVMRLVEQGLLDLDVPVRHYLPTLRLADEEVAARVTLRHLLSHTGGWVGDFFDDTGRGDDALARMVDRLHELPQLTPLGTVWSYNNAGFYLAGRILEVITGQAYEALAHDLILAPLGMTRSFFWADEMITHRVAAGHQHDPHDLMAPPTVARPWGLVRSAHPVGGIVSSVRDQVRYARFHLGDGSAADGTRLLTTESIRAMQTPFVQGDLGGLFGLTWFIRDVQGHRIVRHGGATKGQLAAFLMIPAAGFALTVLTNSSRGAELYRDLTAWAFRTFLGIETPLPVPETRTAAEVRPFVGRYEGRLSDTIIAWAEDGLRLQVIPKGGFPTADSPARPAGPALRAAFCGPDQIVVLNDPLKDTRAEFLRDDAGEIVWLRLGGRVLRRV